MRKIMLILSLAVTTSVHGQQKADTLYVSDLFTTHIIYPTEIIYAHCSNDSAIGRRIIPESRNMIALKALSAFDVPLSLSALESNGELHTHIILYGKTPDSLVYDMRRRDHASAAVERNEDTGDGEVKRKRERRASAAQSSDALYRRSDAPLLKDVVDSSQKLFHMSTSQYGLEATCRNILSYSDIIYLVFSLRNSSGVSYDCPDATFVVESRKRSRKTVVYDRSLFPKSRYGTLSCAPGEVATIGYSLDKMSLSKDQVLRVYFYEQGGQRELVLSISADDINRAKNRL